MIRRVGFRVSFLSRSTLFSRFAHAVAESARTVPDCGWFDFRSSNPTMAQKRYTFGHWDGRRPKAQVEGSALLGRSKRSNFLTVEQASVGCGSIPSLGLWVRRSKLEQRCGCLSGVLHGRVLCREARWPRPGMARTWEARKRLLPRQASLTDPGAGFQTASGDAPKAVYGAQPFCSPWPRLPAVPSLP